MKQILALSESKVTEHTSVIFTAYTSGNCLIERNKS